MFSILDRQKQLLYPFIFQTFIILFQRKAIANTKKILGKDFKMACLTFESGI
jgi:hypothetical protein